MICPPFQRRKLIPALSLLSFAPIATLLPAPIAASGVAASAQDDGPGAGTLLLRGLKEANGMPAVRLGTDMDVSVTGQVARVRVTQAFRNSSRNWTEAVYLYPLPENGAVDGLKMVVGQRVIIGHIEKRVAARSVYEKAKASGQKAGLVEQLRPNMFTTNVANIGPGETVLISIEYQAPVAKTNGTYSLRLPLVIGPRYTPPHTLTSGAAIADAQAITASPVMNPKTGISLNPTSISVHLQPGFDAANIASPYHHILVTGQGSDRTIRLEHGSVPADRDFELNWSSASADPAIGLFRQQTAAGTYIMATITPSANFARLPAPPREMVFVIDNSGSMEGASIEEAKASLLHALATLRPQDHFNIIRFDDTMTQLFEHSVLATPIQLAFARHFTERLQANGGTEMLPALRAALKDAATGGDPAELRQIVFLTDGEVSNEQEMQATLARDGGRSHVFFVGIGSAPNDHLMSRMATIGRGAYVHVGTSDEVAVRMMPLLDMLGHPAMQDLVVRTDGATLDLTPRTLPDLYAGQPLVLVGKADRLAGKLTVGGTIGGQRWERTVNLSQAQESAAIAKLWARRRIDDVETDRTLGKMKNEAADAAITDIGLTSGLVTSQTSLVAVDETPSRPQGAGLRQEDLPINLPAGWSFDGLFGGAEAKHNVGTTAGRPTEPKTPIELPQTATGYFEIILQGLVLLLAGLSGLALRRRQSTAQ